MIFLALFYGILFLIIGYIVKFFQDQRQTRFEEEFYYKFKKFNLLSTNTEKVIKKKPKLFLLNNKSIFVNPNISAALQEIFDFILMKYINSWYQGFSNNEDFVVEIKSFIHTLCSEVLLRLSKIDAASLITDKILPAIVNHLDICYHVMESYDGDINSSSQDMLLNRMKSHFHVIMINRGEELTYLRCISKHVIPLLTPDYLNQTGNKTCYYLLRECLVGTVLLPTMDTIASPDTINRLICLFLDPSSTTDVPVIDSSIVPVPILSRYQQAWINRLKSQKIFPKGFEFLRDEKHLYHFIQYIKSIDNVSPINFLLLMDAITNKLLNPELNETDKNHLLDDLKRLDQLIQSADEYSDLNVTSDLHKRVLQIIAQGHESVTQLINCEIWMENYNAVCRHAEAVYLAPYFESDIFLATIYGDRESVYSLDQSYEQEWEDISASAINTEVVHCLDKTEPPQIGFPFKRMSLDLFNFDFTFDRKSPNTEDIHSVFFTSDKMIISAFPFLYSIFQKEKESLSVNKKDNNKLGNSLKNALAFTDDSTEFGSGEHDLVESSKGNDLTDQSWSFSDINLELPDLSKMRVKVPCISQPKSKNDFYFSVQTFRIDSDEMLYKVFRKYGEFYVLEQKLTEFHGSISRLLPNKKPWDIKKLDYLTNCLCEFETYLMFLINRSFLKNSQLLYRFLTIPSEFNANTPIEVNLGRFVKSVPMKLAKEKGQFLDQFLTNFHISCESGNEPSSITAQKPVQMPIIKSLIDSRLHVKMFWNNAGFNNVTKEILIDQVCTFTNRFMFSFYDTACHIYETITENVRPLHLLLNGAYRVRPMIIKLVESFFSNKIKGGVERICHEKLAVGIIHMLRDAVLITGYTRTNAERAEGRERALQYIRKMFPEWLSVFVHNTEYNVILKRIDRILDCLQQPKLNKQLSYVLFDIVLVELFPELAEEVTDATNTGDRCS